MRILGTLASLAVFSAILLAQPPQEAAKKGPPPAPKNLQVLKPEDNIRAIMRSFTVALGGNCQMCHVQGDFAADTNEHKVIARHMISMTKEINAKFPDGKEHVTCWTCHRGTHEPAMVPPAADAPKPPAEK
jgi:Photosynthetic reaction centre cytochrome C subunit